MGIELGSAIGNIAGSIGKAAPALASFGEEMKAPIGNIVNEGPVGLADLKATVPLGEIRFNEPLSVPNVLAEAESILAQARIPEPKEVFGEVIMPQVEPMVFPVAIPVISPALDIQAGSQLKTESRVSAAPAQSPAILPQPAPVEQEAEEKVKKIVKKKVKKQEPEERLEEDMETESRMYLEDEESSAQRRIEIWKAIVKARSEADRLGLKKIAGWLVAKFLPKEHAGNRSQVVKKTGPDGSYQETVEAITGAGEFESGEKAIERFEGIVAEKKPVKYGKAGIPVATKDVARVFKYRLIKPVQPHEEVVKRVIQKKVSVPQLSVVPPVAGGKKETSLEELNPALAEVLLPKAA